MFVSGNTESATVARDEIQKGRTWLTLLAKWTKANAGLDPQETWGTRFSVPTFGTKSDISNITHSRVGTISTARGAGANQAAF